MTLTSSATARAPSESRAARARTASRTLAGVRPGAGQRLADEERVAARDGEQGRRVDVRAREPADRLDAEALELEAVSAIRWRGGQCAVQRMVGPDLVVAERDDEQRGHRLHAAGDEREHVERRLVGPVRVLDDADRRAVAAKLVEHHAGGVDSRRPKLGGEPELEERAERARHRQVVARSGEHPRRSPLGGDERPHQARLADAGLTADERDRPGSRHHLSERRLERSQLTVTLEQQVPAHARIISAGARAAQPECGH